MGTLVDDLNLALQLADEADALTMERFGASDLRRYEDPKGGLLHAEVKVGDSVVMIADGNEQWPGVLCHIHVYVLDVDAVFQKAVAAGAEVIQEPKTREGDPDKRGGFKDPSGNSWWVSTQTN